MKHHFDDPSTLIVGLQKGDEAAYVYVVEEYHHRLCVYANSLVRDHQMAEDIVQSVFVQVWENRKRLKPDFSIQNLLYRSVYNKFIDQYRKNKSVLAIEKKYIEALEMVVEENKESHIQKMLSMLTEAIHELPPKCKQVFILSKKEGLTNIEISNYLEISTKTVEGQITKAFKILKEKLGTKYETVLLLVFGPLPHNRVSL
ncbi:RNA polymerase sigma factor [Arenibacter lacus]|uniref:RNA polymerase sigma factor n=1 Tax=Arenibacter lacus TaxID=2608629 RepID=UPI00123DB69B|nr:RNA polymerase sigma-70 factor [Arenibacter lacus]